MPDGDSGSPSVISHYRIDEEVGRGGMGAVYRATDLRDQTVVAVKLLRAELAQDPTYRERFEREAHVAALLRSPYTVHLTDYGFAEGQYFLVMDFVQGQSLRQALADGPLEVQRVLRIGEKVARALEEADARGVVHRDIKPDNIMLGEGDTARVLDFGIARQAGTLTLTVAGGFVGSLPYSSPEHATGDVDHRSDIYSLGATLYQALTGVMPFTGTAIELMEQHRITPMPEEPLAGTPEVVVAIVRRCLQKDRADRFQSASELAAALSNAMRVIEQSATAETALVAPPTAETVAAMPPPAATIAATEAAAGAQASAGGVASRIVLSLTNGRPRRLAGIRTGSQRYDLHLRNEGDAPLRATLTASDPDNACRFRLPGQVDTEPGVDTVVPLQIKPRSFRWRGGPVRRDFSVAAAGGGGPPGETHAAFDDVPPRWPMAGGGFFMLAAIVAVLVGLLAGGGGDTPGEQAVAQSDAGEQAEPAAQATDESESAEADEQPTDEQSSADAQAEPESGDATAEDGGAGGTAGGAEDGAEEQAAGGAGDQAEEEAAAVSQNEPVLDPGDISGGRIAFISDRTGVNTIYAMRRNGADLRAITDDGADARGPHWSPDGRRIVYASDLDGNFDIWTISDQGANAVQLTTHPDFDGRPAWSPDGERIAFVSTRDGSFDIWVMDADGGNANPLTNEPGTEFRPTWGPDGEQIVYSSTQDGLIAVFVIEVPQPGQGRTGPTSSPPTRLTDATANDSEPAWSPDGRLIAFESDRDGNSEIYVMNADGSGQRRLTDNLAPDLEPAWSPDSRFVVFMSERDGNLNLYVVEVATGAVARITADIGFEGEASWDDAIEDAESGGYATRLTAIAEAAEAAAAPFLRQIADAPNTQAQLDAIETLWPQVIGIQSDALRQIEDLTPPAPLRVDHDTFVAGFRELLSVQLGLVTAAQSRDVNRVAQANQEIAAETAALATSLSPEYRALVAAILE